VNLVIGIARWPSGGVQHKHILVRGQFLASRSLLERAPGSADVGRQSHEQFAWRGRGHDSKAQLPGEPRLIVGRM
jgi:hypothetical protein